MSAIAQNIFVRLNAMFQGAETNHAAPFPIPCLSPRNLHPPAFQFYGYKYESAVLSFWGYHNRWHSGEHAAREVVQAQG